MQNSQKKHMSELNFYYLLAMVKRHKGLILLSSIFFTIIAFYYTITVPPIYSSSSSIKINNNTGVSAAVFDLTGNSKNVGLENEKQLIKSRLVSELAIQKLWESEDRNNLYLFNTRKFIPAAMDERRYLKEILTFGLYKPRKIQKLILPKIYSLDTLRMYAKKMNKNLSVRNKRNSDIIILNYKSTFPDEAALVLNKIVESYIEIDNVWSVNQAQSVLNFVESQSMKVEKDLLASEEKLKIFKEKHGIFDLSGNSESILNELINSESRLFESVAQVNISEEKRKFLYSKLSTDEKTLASQLSNSINSKVFALRAEISEKEAELIKNSTNLGDDHEVVVRAYKDIENLKNKLNFQVQKMIDQGLVVTDPVVYREELIEQLLFVENELAAFKAKVKEYEKLVSKYNNQLYSLPSLQLSFARLERESSVLNQTYLFLRQKLEESKIQVATESGRLQVIDSAIKNTKKDSPNHKLNLFFGLSFGIIFASLLILLIEYLDRSIKSMDDIDKNLIVLGIIPKIGVQNFVSSSSKLSIKNFKKRIKYYKSLFKKKNLNNKDKDPIRHLIAHTDPKSPISEAYRSIRTNLSYSSVEGDGFKSLIITSTGPGEGKTTTISNVAITYANLGKKVLLVDTDLRRPVLHKVFNIKNKNSGITSYLTQNNIDIESIINKTEINNLSIITSGPIPPNPSELLDSNKMKNLISQLRDDWDIVLFDSPPLIAVTDAALLSKNVDKLGVVVMPGKTDKKAFSHCLESIENLGTNLDGIIFNGIDTRNSYGSYYYYYQYYNYYGSADSK